MSGDCQAAFLSPLVITKGGPSTMPRASVEAFTLSHGVDEVRQDGPAAIKRLPLRHYQAVHDRSVLGRVTSASRRGRPIAGPVG